MPRSESQLGWVVPLLGLVVLTDLALGGLLAALHYLWPCPPGAVGPL